MECNNFLFDYPLCKLEIVKNGKKVNIDCIIDTGSPYTIIPDKFIEKLEIENEEQFTQVTIHGIVHKEECSVEVPGYEIDIIIGDLNFQNSTVFSYQFMNEYGLLGQNILSQCNLFIEWKNKKIAIRKN